MAQLNIIDIIFLAIFFFSVLRGLSRGFVSEVVSLLTLIAAFGIAIVFTQPLADVFTHSSSVQQAVSQSSGAVGVNTGKPVSYFAIGVSFAILFAGTLLAGAILKFLLNMIFSAGMLGTVNRLFGAVFGFARGFMINLVIIFLVQLSPISEKSIWRASPIVNAYQPMVISLGNIVSPGLAGLKGKFQDTVDKVSSVI